VALLGAVAEAQHPVLGVVTVVGGLLDGLGRQGVAGELPEQQLLVGGEVELARDGVREVPVRLLDELAVAERPLLPQVGQFVLVAEPGVERAGLAEQVQRDVGERDLLLQRRCVPDPLAQSVGEDEGVVGEGESGTAPRFFTPSGTS
jgi:hypothetical protein